MEENLAIFSAEPFTRITATCYARDLGSSEVSVPLQDWVDVPAIQKICRHVSTFVIGLLISAIGKPAIWIAEAIGNYFHQPTAQWLLWFLGKSDDVLLAFFALSLGIRLVIELWPFNKTHHLLLIASIYASGAHHG